VTITKNKKAPVKGGNMRVLRILRASLRVLEILSLGNKENPNSLV
jgi:hypothetical protein